MSGFDWYYADNRFYKLDLLVNDEIAILSRLAKETGIHPNDISFDDLELMTMFKENEEHLFPCAGLPEFGSDFVINSLAIAKPNNFEELGKLLGFMHGTGLWLENGFELVVSGEAEFADIPSFREEVYHEFLKYGFTERQAYEMAEYVRKGNIYSALKRQEKSSNIHENVVLLKWDMAKDILQEGNAPDWYIPYLEKVQYMFPKAHALGYLEKTWQLAWYKLHYSKEYNKIMSEYEFVKSLMKKSRK